MTQFRTTDSRVVHRGRYLRLRVDTIDLGGGRSAEREIVQHPGAVVIVPIGPEGNVLMVRQYRHAAAAWLLELPAGTLEPGEEPLRTAQRELREETGYSAGRWERIMSFYTAPGFCTEFMHLYLATGLYPDPLDKDEDEEITVEPVPLQRAIALVESGEIKDAKSIAGLLVAEKRLAGMRG